MAWGKPGEQVGRVVCCVRCLGACFSDCQLCCWAGVLHFLASPFLSFSSFRIQQDEEEVPDKEVEPEFGLSGALAAETNKVK